MISNITESCDLKLIRTKIFVFLLFFLQIQIFAQFPPTYTAIVKPGAPGGYYFTDPFKASSGASTQMVLDSTGDWVYFKYLSITTYDFKQHSNGKVSYFDGKKFCILNSNFVLIDSIKTGNGITTDVHDLQILSNGHYLILGTEKAIKDLSNYYMFLGNESPGGQNAMVVSNVIQELDQNKNVVFEWHANTHMSFDSADDFFLFSPTYVDWSHANAVEMDYDGNILLSSRHFNEITKINHSNGNIMWRFGGNYNQFTYLTDTLPFYGQHDVRRIGNGHITLFDNGNHDTPHPARALEYDLDEVNMTAKLVWSYVLDSAMSSKAMGNVQRLITGNTLVDYGMSKNFDSTCFNVVSYAGNELFSCYFQNSLYSYRSFNYPRMPAGFVRPQITCFDSLGLMFLDAGPGYSSYLWSNGGQTRMIPIFTQGIYSVQLPTQNGGYLKSEKFNTVNSQCRTTSLSHISQEKNISVFPNPAKDVLNVQISSSLTNHIQVTDILGRKYDLNTISKDDNIEINISSLNDGIYFLDVNGVRVKFLKN